MDEGEHDAGRGAGTILGSAIKRNPANVWLTAKGYALGLWSVAAESRRNFLLCPGADLTPAELQQAYWLRYNMAASNGFDGRMFALFFNPAGNLNDLLLAFGGFVVPYSGAREGPPEAFPEPRWADVAPFEPAPRPVETAPPAPRPRVVEPAVKEGVPAEAATVPKGGEYGKVRAGTKGGEVHHMPAAKVTPYPYRKAPASWMETADHRKTASWGSSKAAEAYRQNQADLIGKGKLREAIQMDIDDIRAKFGTKYDANIKEMLDAYGFKE